MKKLLIAASVAITCAASAVADVAGANVFGLLTVLSSSADTIVAVPWCDCSTADNQPIAISNIVKTANLTVGDQLAALSTNGVYLNTWTLTSGAGGVLYWKSDKTVVENGVTAETIAADKTYAARGTAILLHRQSPTEGGNPKPFYLYGQVGTSPSVTSTIENAGASAATPVYTLIAPPTDGDVNILSALSSPVANDSIVVRNLKGIARTYTYDGSAWKYRATPVASGETTAESITIKAGTGAWYVSRNSSAKPTITWTSIPVK